MTLRLSSSMHIQWKHFCACSPCLAFVQIHWLQFHSILYCGSIFAITTVNVSNWLLNCCVIKRLIILIHIVWFNLKSVRGEHAQARNIFCENNLVSTLSKRKTVICILLFFFFAEFRTTVKESWRFSNDDNQKFLFKTMLSNCGCHTATPFLARFNKKHTYFVYVIHLNAITKIKTLLLIFCTFT